MRLKTVIAATIVALALTVGAGFGAAQVMRTDSAKAGGSSAVVRQLKTANRHLASIESSMRDVESNTDAIGDRIGTSTLYDMQTLQKRTCSAILHGYSYGSC